VSARDLRAARESDTHAAATTSGRSRTPENFIVGVGASGALLAGAAIAFISLVGMVSFDVWPSSLDSPPGDRIDLGAAIAQAQPGARSPPGPTADTNPAAVGAGKVSGNGKPGGGKHRGRHHPGDSLPGLTPGALPAPTEPGAPGAGGGPGNGGNGNPGGGDGDTESGSGGGNGNGRGHGGSHGGQTAGHGNQGGHDNGHGHGNSARASTTAAVETTTTSPEQGTGKGKSHGGRLKV
jgi:hypothetical protein